MTITNRDPGDESDGTDKLSYGSGPADWKKDKPMLVRPGEKVHYVSPSSPIPLSEAMKRLGYESPEELRQLRELEDIAHNPRVSVLADYYKTIYKGKLDLPETEDQEWFDTLKQLATNVVHEYYNGYAAESEGTLNAVRELQEFLGIRFEDET